MQLSDPSPAAIPRRSDERAAVRILTEVRAHLGSPLTLAVLASAALACGIAGPFGTGSYLTDGPRFLFWAVMVAVTYAAGTLASETAWQIAGRRLAALPGRLAGALGPALVTPPVVLSLNTLMLGTPYPFEGLAGFAASLFVVGGLVGLLVDLATGRPFGRQGVAGSGRQATGGGATAGGTTADGTTADGTTADGLARPTEAQGTPPRIMARLPDDLRGPLVALSARDHHVRVRTTRGDGLVLMRLADAIAEADGTPGLRVHRSHWVATGKVRAVRCRGYGAVLTMASGPEIPVSRAHVSALRAAGLPAGKPDASGRNHG